MGELWEMFFWFYMLIMTLLIPWVLRVFGQKFVEDPPQEINATYGYRTKQSMQNEQTWRFAHNYCGILWGYTGRLFMPVSLVAMLMVFGKSYSVIVLQAVVMVILQFLVLMVTMGMTEHALKKEFHL